MRGIGEAWAAATARDGCGADGRGLEGAAIPAAMDAAGLVFHALLPGEGAGFAGGEVVRLDDWAAAAARSATGDVAGVAHLSGAASSRW